MSVFLFYHLTAPFVGRLFFRNFSFVRVAVNVVQVRDISSTSRSFKIPKDVDLEIWLH